MCYEKGRIFFYPCVEEGECGCVEDNAEAVCFYFFISTFSVTFSYQICYHL
ncbi:unnamed protein product [Camellia sinensis]